MRLLGFDENDLAANRDGRLSQRQVERLRQSRQTKVLKWLIPMFGIPVIFVGLILIGRDPSFLGPILLCVPVIVLIELILANRLYSSRTPRGRVVLEAVGVHTISGQVFVRNQTYKYLATDQEGGGSSAVTVNRYCIVVKETDTKKSKLRISPGLFIRFVEHNAFDLDARYSIYFCLPSQWQGTIEDALFEPSIRVSIVSAEKVS